MIKRLRCWWYGHRMEREASGEWYACFVCGHRISRYDLVRMQGWQFELAGQGAASRFKAWVRRVVRRA